MGKYNVAYSSRILDIEEYSLPEQHCYRPLQDEYICSIKKSDKEQKIFKKFIGLFLALNIECTNN